MATPPLVATDDTPPLKLCSNKSNSIGCVVLRGGCANTAVVGDAVDRGDCTADGELLVEFCPHGDIPSLGVVF